MADNDQPIPDDFDAVEAARESLGLQSEADRLEELVHPVAEAFVSQFDEAPVTEQLPRPILKFSGCVSEAAARRLFGSLLAGINHDTYLAMMTCFQLGWRAAEQFHHGSLEIPE
jgi:hypothetical protein